MSQPVTVAAQLRRDAAQLRQAGFDSPDLDARLLLGEAMQWQGLSASLHGDEIIGAEALLKMAGFVQRRLGHEPVARILGQKEFWGIEFTLSADTLVPRPDSEAVVEAALAALGDQRREPLTLLDIGTGSGCLLIALLHECGHATGFGVDVSQGALAMARHNAARAGVGPRAHWAATSWSDALHIKADLVVSNPPYITTGDMFSLAKDVRNHDPQRALDGGADGLDAYRALAESLPHLLKPGAHAVLELGAGQLRDVSRLMAGAGLVVKGSHRDLDGHERALILEHSPN